MPTETLTADTDWTVPDGVFEVKLTLEGEAGGGSNGGTGGRVVGTLAVGPGDELFIRDSPGGTGAGDGGRSVDVRRNGTALSDRIAVAAGGGGNSSNSGVPPEPGGDGGPDTGEDGERGGLDSPGLGGTQTTGGAGSGGGTDGSFGAGGDGGNDDYSGGAGGAGWYGGGGGGGVPSFGSGGRGSSGGGGSNYDDGLDNIVANERGTSTRDHGQGGLVTIEYEVGVDAVENLQITDSTETTLSLSWDALDVGTSAFALQ